MNKTVDLAPLQKRKAIPAWTGYAGFLWALMYAVFVRFYQAAGGDIGLPGRFINPEGFFMASFIAGVLILAAGFVVYALVKPWSRVFPPSIPLIGGRKVPHGILLIPALVGCAFALAHGISGVVTKALGLAGIITIDFQGWAVLDVHRLMLWDLLVYEPWFIIMGILAALAAFHYGQASHVPRVVLRRVAMLFLSFVVLLTTLFVLAIIFDRLTLT